MTGRREVTVAVMRVLVTRPAEDAGPLAEALEARGFEPVLEPLLEIRFLAGAALDLAGVQALAFTSANGVRALVNSAPGANDSGHRVFAVGAATAKAASDAGFEDVISADGDVAALAEVIIAECPPQGGAVLHVAGTRRAGDLVAALEDAGIEAQRVVLYEAVAARSLSESLRHGIAAGEIGTVLIFSPRTAALFVNLMTDAGLAAHAHGMVLVALSPAVVEAASALSWGAVRIADKPDGDALLRALGQPADGI